VWSGIGWSATITVTTTEPGVIADGLCSFAEAVDNVREGDAHADCVVGEVTGNTIELGENETYLLEGPYDEYHTGEYPLVIEGNGSTLEDFHLVLQGPRVTIRDLNIWNGTIGWKTGYSPSSSTGSFRVERCEFVSGLGLVIQVGDAAEGVDATIEETVFPGGHTGVFIHDESLQENLYRIVDCDFLGTREGILFFSDSGLLSINNCLFDDNDFGVLASGAAVEITRSSFIDNYAGVGATSSANLFVSSCTFYENLFGISVSDSAGSIRIKHSTFVQNGISLGGWLDAFSIENTVLTTNGDIYSGNCDPYSFPDTSPTSLGFNIENDDYNESCNFDHHTDMVVADVMLSELGYFGGRTPVHRPLEGSPVIDMGDTDCPRKDQRGFKRPTDGNGDGVAVCDCGAVEYNSYPLPTPYEHETLTAVDE
jgi:parallel beta-helix repeat protein